MQMRVRVRTKQRAVGARRANRAGVCARAESDADE